MRRLWIYLVALVFVAAPALCAAQNLPGNYSCQDLLDFASGKASRRPPVVTTAEKTDVPIRASTLTVGESGVPLLARQDDESEIIATLEKGEEIIPLAHAVGTGSRY